MVTNTGEKGRTSLEDRTLKDLSPNVAALLCYVAGWISGIVFLVLEQKNRLVRFHALQSIIVFGSLTVAGTVLGNIPIIGIAFSVIIGIIAFVLWIVLMIKALNGEYFKMPWAGDLAEKLAHESMTPRSTTVPGTTAPGTLDTSNSRNAGPAEMSFTRPTRGEAFRAKYYSGGARMGRVIGSSFAIAWNVIFLVFLNFFNQYIAYYQPSYSGGITHWHYTPLVTSDFSAWLPIVTAALVAGIIGHALTIAFDKYILREFVELLLSAFGLAAVISLLVIFPFDFSVIPNTDAAFWAATGLTITLIIVAVGIGIGAIVRFIRMIVNVVEEKY
jgi:uncharacterized membrane protein